MTLRLMFLMVIAAVVVRGADSADRTLSGQEILAQMSRRYASCESYRDSGVVKASIEGTEQVLPEQPFETKFCRSGLFRFDWQMLLQPGVPPKKCSVWTDGDGVCSYCEPAEFFREQNLASAVARAAGISGGAVHTVPRLLMPDLGGKAITDLGDLELLREESMSGVDCFVVKGTRGGGGDPASRAMTYELWIGKTDYLLRRIRMRAWAQMLGSWAVTEETRADVEIDVDITRGEFEALVPIGTELKIRKGR